MPVSTRMKLIRQLDLAKDWVVIHSWMNGDLDLTDESYMTNGRWLILTVLTVRT